MNIGLTEEARDRQIELEAEYLLKVLPPCSQCGNKFAAPVCGFAHTAIQSRPHTHRLAEKVLLQLIPGRVTFDV
jgi:hypothetical protein